MQDRYVFRELLSEMKALADQKGNRLTTEEIRAYFHNTHLTEEQFQLVFEYLAGEKIEIVGYKKPKKESLVPKQEEQTDVGEETEEETDYLKLYADELARIHKLKDEEEMELFDRVLKGDSLAKSRLTENYLSLVYDISRTFAYGSLSQEDLIQEGNIGLILALEELEKREKLEDYREFLYTSIAKSMEDAVNEQQDVKEMDERIAERVNHLDEAVKNLERDLEHKVSVEELSAYLDMPAEEIEDIMRMAGDKLDISRKQERS